MKHLKVYKTTRFKDGVKQEGFQVSGLTGGVMDMPFESWDHFMVFKTEAEAKRMLVRIQGGSKRINVPVDMAYWIYSGGATDAQGKAWLEASPEEVWN